MRDRVTHYRRQSAPRAVLAVLVLTTLALAVGATPALAVGPPLISAPTVSEIAETSATLQATVNPNGRKTEYHFEYISDAAYQANPEAERFVGASQAPVPDAPITTQLTEDHAVSIQVGGLSPGITYHYRLVATNFFSPEGGTPGPERTFATYAPPPNFSPCPNDAFRAGHPSAALPDCRAYEQVTPVDKNGADAGGEIFKVQAALEGDAVTSQTQAGLPGGVGLESFPIYLSRRDASGWSTQGLLPPPSFGENAFTVGWTPDLAYVFDAAKLTGSDLVGELDSALLARASFNGSFQEIVPYVDGAAYFFVGASADDSKLFFESTGEGVNLTGDAAPGKDNLYLFDRDTGVLHLVGVLPDSTCASSPCTPPNGSFAGPYDWWHGISPATLGRGGAAAEYATQELHAISTDGDSAYFTAGKTGQIYHRQGLTGPSPETVHVSASQRTEADPAGTAPAAFQSATPDGSKAFFTSSEKLTADATTGPEPEPPAIARAGIDGNGIDLKFLPARASGLAIDGSHVYWADPEAGTVGRAKLNENGGATEVEEEFIVPGPVEVEGEPGVFESVPSKPQWVAVDGSHVYWTNDADGEDLHGTIGRAKLGAGEAEEVEPEFITGASNPQGIAVDATHIYWANDGSNNTGPKHGIARANVDGSEPIQPWSVNGDGEPAGFPAQGVALDGTYVYFTPNAKGGSGSGSGNIERIRLAEPKDFHSILFTGTTDKFKGIAVDGTYIYWTNTATGTIGRAKLNNPEQNVTEVTPSFITGAGKPQGLALDASHLYWSANQGAPSNPGNDLYRFEPEKPAGERLTDLTADPNPADENGAEVQGVLGTSDDGSYVYFVANGDLDGVSGPGSLGNCQRGEGGGFSYTGSCSLYLSQNDDVTFIARLDLTGGALQSDAANWQPTPQLSPTASLEKARVSADGQTVVFRSQRQLSTYVNAATPEFYRYHLGDPAPTCVTCNPTSAPPIGPPTLRSIQPAGATRFSTASILTRFVSASGDQVFFETPDKLAGADTNGDHGCPPSAGGAQNSVPACQDVYEWEAEGSGSCRSSAAGGGCLYLLSSGTSPYPSFFGDASLSGEDVFIFTRDRLVPQDQDQIQDVYDARFEGGLASQNQPPPPPPCEGDACKSAPSAAPPAASAGTTAFRGPGNPTPLPPCPTAKGKVRKQGKCVTKHQRKKKHRKHQAKRADRNHGGAR